MPAVLPNTPTTDNYPSPTQSGGAQIGLQDIFESGFFVVANAAVFGQYFHGERGQSDNSPDIYMPPGTYPLTATDRDPLGGIRFRSAVVGVPAQVFGVLYYKDEAKLLSSAEFTATVTPSGGITPGASFVIGYATTLPLTPTDGDFTILVDNLTAATYYWLMRWNAGANRWEFMGGDPMTNHANYTGAVVNTGTQVGATGYWHHPQMRHTVPYGGSYIVRGSVTIALNGGAAGFGRIAAFNVNALAQDNDSDVGASNQEIGGIWNLTGVVAGSTIGIAVAAFQPGTYQILGGNYIITPEWLQ